MTSTAIEQTAPAVYRIQGREVRLPVEVRDATAAVAYYLVPAKAAQQLIAASGLRVAQPLPGKAICTIGAVEYKDNDLGPYREIAVTFFVHEPGARSMPFPATLISLVRGSLATYIHHLPVDGEFTCEAGQTIWGFPKFMSEISVSRAGETASAVLRVDGQHVLTQSMRMGGTRSFGDRTQIAFANRDGALYRTPSTMRGEDVGARLGGAKLELGTHAIADELRLLGLPMRALFSTYITKMQATFGVAQATFDVAQATFDGAERQP